MIVIHIIGIVLLSKLLVLLPNRISWIKICILSTSLVGRNLIDVPCVWINLVSVKIIAWGRLFIEIIRVGCFRRL